MKRMHDKKIALFMLPLLTQGGGAEKFFMELAKIFRERGIEADVVTMDEKFFAGFAKILYLFAYRRWFANIDISGRENEESIRNQMGKARWIKVNRKNLKKILQNYDIVYSKNELVDLGLLKLAGYGKIPPVVVGVHTPIYFPEAKFLLTKLHNFIYSGIIYKWFLRGTKLIHVSNFAAKNLVEKKFEQENELIYYPFSIEAVREQARKNRCRLNFNSAKKKIIFIGRLSEQKGIDRLLEIIRRVSRENSFEKKVEINIFGSSDIQHEKTMKKLEKVYSFVRWYGHVENKYIPDILSQHDLLISTSRWETLPYNILEAQAMGLPAIAFNIPGPADIIEDGKTGFLVQNEKEFCEKIIATVSGKSLFNAQDIKINVKNKFDPDKIFDKMENMFGKIATDYGKN